MVVSKFIVVFLFHLFLLYRVFFVLEFFLQVVVRVRLNRYPVTQSTI